MPRRRFDTVDIAKHANRPLVTNPVGSPNAEGIDFVWAHPGVQHYEMPGIGKIPFKIVDQNENNGVGVCITQGGVVKHQPSMQFPKRFDFVLPQNQRSRVIRVHALGIAAFWAVFSTEAPGTHGADFVFTYTDGTQVVQPIINSIHYGDWAFDGFEEVRRNGDGTQVMTAVQGLTTSKEYTTRAYIVSMDLVAHAHRNLEQISLVDTGSTAAIPLLALTLEREVTVTTDSADEGAGALRDIAPAVRLGDRKRLEALLESLFQDIKLTAQDSMAHAQSQGILLLSLLAHAAQEMDNSSEQIQLLPLQAAKSLLELKTPDRLVEELKERVDEVERALYPNRNLHTERVITQAMDHIKMHYAEDLQDDTIAELVNLSTSHFRYLFRVTTGMSFGKYLTLVRMENARRLLEDTHLTVGEVARKVGYEDVSYFSRVFSQHFWVTPTEYRRKSV